MILTYILVAISIGLGIILWMIWRRVSTPAQPTEDNSQRIIQSLNSSMHMLQTNLHKIEEVVHNRMQSSEDRLNENFRHQTATFREQTQSSLNAISQITERLGRLDETNKQVMSFTEQLRSFQDILKNPKQRGTIIGEYYLETILSRVLPPSTYKTQYSFPNGEIVDAAIFVGEHIIPVDSKFSLDNYNRIVEANNTGNNADSFVSEFKKDIKTRIDETSKYILPSQGTLDFAFMFIPHESIYYDLLVSEVGAIKVNTQDLVSYAFQKKVIMVSPTSFLAYLQTVLQGLRALRIEKDAQEIRKNVEELGRHMKSYEEYHGKLGTALGTVVNHYTATNKEFKKIEKDVMRITGEKLGIDTVDVSKPMLE